MDTATADPGAAVGEGAPAGLPSVHRLRCHIEAQDPLSLPAFPGSALRGLIGFGLRRTVCVTGQKRCEGCPLTASCAYYRFFEDSRPRGEAGRAAQAGPHPYVLDVPPPPGPVLEPGARYAFGLTLLGEARHLVPYLVVGVNRAGQQRGLGPRDARFTLGLLEQEQRLGREDWAPVGGQGEATVRALETAQTPGAPAAGVVAVELRSPLRLKRRGRLVGPQEFTPALFLEALGLRLADLARTFGEPGPSGAHLPLPEPPPAEAFGAPEVRWREWTRFSTRQQTRMQMGGLVGAFTVDLARAGDWAHWLWLGQWLHVGKATAMGLGGYRLVPAASL